MGRIFYGEPDFYEEDFYRELDFYGEVDISFFMATIFYGWWIFIVFHGEDFL